MIFSAKVVAAVSALIRRIARHGSGTMAADPELAEAFYRLTPGRQKSYVIHLNSAKHSATRLDRIARCRDKIIAGKGAMER